MKHLVLTLIAVSLLVACKKDTEKVSFNDMGTSIQTLDSKGQATSVFQYGEGIRFRYIQHNVGVRDLVYGNESNCLHHLFKVYKEDGTLFGDVRPEGELCPFGFRILRLAPGERISTQTHWLYDTANAPLPVGKYSLGLSNNMSLFMEEDQVRGDPKKTDTHSLSFEVR